MINGETYDIRQRTKEDGTDCSAENEHGLAKGDNLGACGEVQSNTVLCANIGRRCESDEDLESAVDESKTPSLPCRPMLKRMILVHSQDMQYKIILYHRVMRILSLHC